MSECCVTTSPKITIKPNSCSKNTVQASRSDSSVGIGCVPSTPRDLVGAGLLVSMYYYDSTIGQTVFQGPDRNANTLQNASLETSLVLVNGVVLDNDQYTLTEGTLTLNDGCLTSDDIVSVIVFREPAEAEDSVVQGQVTTVDVLTIPPGSDSTRPINLPDNLELVTTQFDANWFLNDRIDDVEKKVDDLEIPDEFDPEGLATEEWVLDQSYITEQVVIDAVADLALTAYVDSQDANLQTQIDALSASGGYNDSWIQPAIDSGDATYLADAKAYTDQEIAAIPPVDLSDYATKKESTDGDDVTLADAKAYTDQEIAAIPPVDLSGYATKKESTDGDAKSLEDAKKYTDTKFDAVTHPPGTIVKDTEPANSPNGTNWFDTVRLELFVRASDSWLPSSPLGARVSQGELVQAQIIDQIAGLTTTEYVDAQDATKIGNTGEQILPTATWKLRARKVDDSGNYSYLAIQDDSLRLYHVADPTADAHGMSRGYADARYQFTQRQIVFKCDQYVTCTTSPTPASGEFCGLNNSSPGSATSPNPYFGNWNNGMRVDASKLLNPEGNEFTDMERYTFEGTVTILDDTGKLYFKANAHSVSRTNNHSYVDITFGSRVPAFGTGSYSDSEKYIVIVEGLESVVPATSNAPEGDE